tara:strand:+ start:16946 stop:18340 length:1395 start_codon:yes stop_codon:yes gene_type:complete
MTWLEILKREFKSPEEFQEWVQEEERKLRGEDRTHGSIADDKKLRRKYKDNKEEDDEVFSHLMGRFNYQNATEEHNKKLWKKLEPHFFKKANSGEDWEKESTPYARKQIGNTMLTNHYILKYQLGFGIGDDVPLEKRFYHAFHNRELKEIANNDRDNRPLTKASVALSRKAVPILIKQGKEMGDETIPFILLNNILERQVGPIVPMDKTLHSSNYGLMIFVSQLNQIKDTQEAKDFRNILAYILLKGLEFAYYYPIGDDDFDGSIATMYDDYHEDATPLVEAVLTYAKYNRKFGKELSKMWSELREKKRMTNSSDYDLRRHFERSQHEWFGDKFWSDPIVKALMAITNGNLINSPTTSEKLTLGIVNKVRSFLLMPRTRQLSSYIREQMKGLKEDNLTIGDAYNKEKTKYDRDKYWRRRSSRLKAPYDYEGEELDKLMQQFKREMERGYDAYYNRRDDDAATRA